jgi:signal transduction histidine kinase
VANDVVLTATVLAIAIAVMLELADLDGGRVEAVRETPLAHAVADTVDRCLPEAEEHGVTLSVEGPDVDRLVDPVSLDVVLRNLVSNAVQYSSEGGTVRIRFVTTERERVLEVEDAGVGIAPADLPRVFDPATGAAQALGGERRFELRNACQRERTGP